MRFGRAEETQAWNNALMAELRAAREAAAAAQGQVLAMQDEKKAFFEQQMVNEVEKAKRPKRCNDEAL